MDDEENKAPCCQCGELIEPDDAFWLIEGSLVHDGECVASWRLLNLDVDVRLGEVES